MDYEAMCASNQRGAVLIFSLVMLLLLTLASVSMIQQNKQELAMTGNTMEQTLSFARAETDLSLAEQAIKAARVNLATPDDHRCNSSVESQVNEDWIFSGDTATGQATITAVYCVTSAGAAEERCTFTDGVRDTIGACNCIPGTEIYALRWTSTVGSNYGAQRTVESKYAVDCSAGSF